MHKDPFVFSQFVRSLDRNHFNYPVRKYDGDNYVKIYTYWNQLLTMMSGQISNRESLRDLIVVQEAHAGKVCHLEIGKSATSSNRSKAKEQRNCRIFEEFVFFMIAEARRRLIQKILELDSHVFAFVSSTINLCLSVFEWAKFRRYKGGIKMHTLYDAEAKVPAFVHITEAKSIIQRLCRRFRMKMKPTMSSIVTTTISIYALQNYALLNFARDYRGMFCSASNMPILFNVFS